MRRVRPASGAGVGVSRVHNHAAQFPAGDVPAPIVTAAETTLLVVKTAATDAGTSHTKIATSNARVDLIPARAAPALNPRRKQMKLRHRSSMK